MTMRLPNWPRLLDEYVNTARARPFAWGALDCCSFAAGAVRAITGRDVPMPSWCDRREAAATLRRLGGLRAAVCQRLGDMQPAALARRGDVLLLRQRGRDVLAVCLGHAWASPGRAGLAFGPMDEALGAWRID